MEMIGSLFVTRLVIRERLDWVLPRCFEPRNERAEQSAGHGHRARDGPPQGNDRLDQRAVHQVLDNEARHIRKQDAENRPRDCEHGCLAQQDVQNVFR